MNDFYEFFAGGGMVRAGLGATWRCRFANDFDCKKAAVYRANWGDEVLKVADIRSITTSDLPGVADLAWASFPCQDLSLAGRRSGLKGDRSGRFWTFWSLMRRLVSEGRGPRLIALENVCGALTSNGGRDFVAICAAFHEAGYSFGAVVIDAANFVPQSRPRMFFVAVRNNMLISGRLATPQPLPIWHTRSVQAAHKRIPPQLRRDWVWWSLPAPNPRETSLADVVEDQPSDVEWNATFETQTLLAMTSDANRAKIEQAQAARKRIVGTAYKRTRLDNAGVKVQRAELRFDGVAGCLRSPTGGSSRQTIIVVHGDVVRSRLISGRETARLMGLPDTYQLPNNYNDAYQLTGDGVVVPVVRHLAHHVFEPILDNRSQVKAAA